MKILLTTGGVDQPATRIFPTENSSPCVENWGNVFCEIGDLDWMSGPDFASTRDDFFEEYDVIVAELLPFQWVGLATMDCKRPLVIGISHAPPHNIEIENPLRKMLIFDAMKNVDLVFSQDDGIYLYRHLFRIVPHDIFSFPHPLRECQFEDFDFSSKKKEAILFHRMDVGNHDFDFILTLSILTFLEVKTKLFVFEDDLELIAAIMRRLSLSVDVRRVVSQGEFAEEVKRSLVACQIATRPSLGRTVPLSVEMATISVASGYMYQKLLYPSFTLGGIQNCSDEFEHMVNFVLSMDEKSYLTEVILGRNNYKRYTISSYVDKVSRIMKRHLS